MVRGRLGGGPGWRSVAPLPRTLRLPTFADTPGELAPGITLEHATDVMWTYSAPALYELLVLRCGWELERYGQFLGQAIAAALLP